MSTFPHQKDIKKIIERYLAGKATDEEVVFIEAYYKFLGKGENEISNADEIQDLELQNFKAIQSKIASSKKSRIVPFYKYASAAAVLILISFGLYFFLNQHVATKDINAVAKTKTLDLLPGSDKAVLTLADGSKIILDDKTSANISDKEGVKITKTKDGLLVYTVLDRKKTSSSNISFNTIQTPKGGQYQVVLPDGTRVWLNAASTLKYPEVFAGNERSVTLTGEAYFEVAKDKTKPFHVQTQNQNVEVLGTHFNINGYMDEQTIKTTLLEGSVKVSNLKSARIIKPGEQAVVGLAENAAINVLANVDTDDETAWKNGLFQFNDTDLKMILNQLERWYDVKIDYSSIPNKRYNGMVPRKSRLSKVLEMLEKTGNIKFELAEGRQLKVISSQK